MKFAAVILVIVVLALLLWALFRLMDEGVEGLTRIVKRRKEDTGEWRVAQRRLPGRQVGIFLISPGGEPEIFGEPVSQRLPEYEFEELLAERRVGAEARAATLNRRLGP